ncbi:unnamed protein product, partial [Prorocentrum cordatum]
MEQAPLGLSGTPSRARRERESRVTGEGPARPHRTEMLGPALGQRVAHDAAVEPLHELPTAMATMMLAFHAQNGMMIGIRNRPLTSSFAAIFFHFAKTNKSGVNSLLERGAVPFELWVNSVELAKWHNAKGDIKEEHVPITLTFLPGATMEELSAQCDPTKAGRSYFSVLHGHDEFAGVADELGIFGSNPRSKARQSDFNYLIDKGTPSKVLRDDSKNYGKNLFEAYKQQVAGGDQVTRRVAYHCLSGMSAKHVQQILGTDGMTNAQATRERCVFFTAPVVNPYDNPPADVITVETAPLAFDLNTRELKRDAAGFIRDNLEPKTDLLENMKRCYNYVNGLPNQTQKFHIEALAFFRRVDSTNWKLAGLVQYICDQTAAELRQCQRMLAIFSTGVCSLHIFYGIGEGAADVKIGDMEVTLAHVKSGRLLLGLIMAENSVGFGAQVPADIPALKKG